VTERSRVVFAAEAVERMILAECDGEAEATAKLDVIAQVVSI
jgi:hypothetical protein